jgi:acetyltransferase-like isoleucine patch superfamily enzyme
MRRFFNLLDCLWLWVIQDMPGELGFRLRSRYWKRRFKHLGAGARIDCGVHFYSPECISVEDNSWIDRGVIILAGRDRSARKTRWMEVRSLAGEGEVRIGRNVHIGAFSIISGIEGGVHIGDDCTFSPAVKVYAFSHHFRFEDDPGNRGCSFGSMVGQERQSMICGPVTLEGNTGVAINAVVLPGVWIGRDSFVAIGSVVKSGVYEENSLLSGSPAVRSGERFRDRQSGVAAQRTK